MYQMTDNRQHNLQLKHSYNEQIVIHQLTINSKHLQRKIAYFSARIDA